VSEWRAALLCFVAFLLLIGTYVVMEGEKSPKTVIIIVPVPIEVPKNLKDWI